ncbi:MAG: ComEA family DNA-binding protein [Eggerthellaceae bacterium]|jgi:competence protein ComEA|nr:ComEA family DNA-binding protein [Eggerthellaceae bacterium]MDR2715519.1 ComEA family DNA-binding protein [Coriobacteriaceae bacterium]
MPFQESADTFRAKAHISNVKSPVLLGLGALVLVVVFLVLQNTWDLVQGSGFSISRQSGAEAAQQADEGLSEAPAPVEEAPPVWVHVGGAVVSPGLYELQEGARVHAVIEAAGGFTQEASPDTVNLARVLVDGEQIIIPTVGEAAAYQEAAPQGPGAPAPAGKVNLNTATMSELTTLPGVGEATAKKIIADREANGPFLSVEDIMRVSGIGEKKFADMLPLITV